MHLWKQIFLKIWKIKLIFAIVNGVCERQNIKNLKMPKH
jgi:hypothetical protein